MSDFNSILKYLKRKIGPKDVLITMGAGDIYKFGMEYLNMLKKKQPDRK